MMIYLGTSNLLNLHILDYYYDVESSKILAFIPYSLLTYNCCDFTFNSEWRCINGDVRYNRKEIPGKRLINTDNEREELMLSIILEKILII